MSYFNAKTVNLSFEDAVQKVTGELAKEGFGVLTEIDVQATLKKKLDVNFRKYKILGACNPPFAYEALQNEEHIGVMLPCNIIVQEKEGKVEVAAINPMNSMQGVQNANLEKTAIEITERLIRVIKNL
jgi:uncharacterized protein (DUF302 family)